MRNPNVAQTEMLLQKLAAQNRSRQPQGAARPATPAAQSDTTPAPADTQTGAAGQLVDTAYLNRVSDAMKEMREELRAFRTNGQTPPIKVTVQAPVAPQQPLKATSVHVDTDISDETLNKIANRVAKKVAPMMAEQQPPDKPTPPAAPAAAQPVPKSEPPSDYPYSQAAE